MTKINWCFNKKNGLELIESNNTLSDSYIKEAENDLETCLNISGKWKVISGYYACYNALYSILMKLGIKSEIHDCSIALMSLLDFEEQDIKFLENLKDLRIKNQYYLQSFKLDDENSIKDFIVKSKLILSTLNTKKVLEIRKQLEELK